MDDFSPDDIDRVPTTAPAPDFDPAQSRFYSRLIAELQNKLADAESELNTLRAKNLLIETRVGLMEPYSKNVFRFVVCYCVGVFILLMLQGACENFELPDVVLGVIAGSTAVAALGLVGIVLKGLFRD